MNTKVDFYFDRVDEWQRAIQPLRYIILDCGLNEELKWGCPCYTAAGKNVVLIHTFKSYCAILFFKGALLKDEHHLLVHQSENVQAARQLRFTSAEQVIKQELLVKEYVQQAIAVEEAGLKVDLKKTTDFKMPEEFAQQLENTPGLKAAFNKLTPGRQRAYLLHFAQPKQAKTRLSRIEKHIPHILDGKGLNDE